MSAGLVLAAGGAVLRTRDEVLEVLLVHRPAYRDWTLPKGKCDGGESDEDCARREVWEETGYTCALGRELPTISYHDRHGRPKRVRYWEMTVEAGEFTPTTEVDEVAWLTIAEARARLTYPRDREILDAVLA